MSRGIPSWPGERVATIRPDEQGVAYIRPYDGGPTIKVIVLPKTDLRRKPR